MNFGKEFQIGLKSYGEAHRVIFRYKLVKYLIIPGIISVGYSVLYFFLAIKVGDAIASEQDSYPWWLGWLGNINEWFVTTVYWGAAVWIFFVSFKYVIQIFLSPMLTKLSEIVEFRVAGRKAPKTTFKDYVNDVKRALSISWRNLWYEIIFCLAAGWIPIIGGIVAFFVSSFYFGFAYMDYTLERKRMNLEQSVKFVKTHRGLSVGIGTICQLGMLVPVIGWLLTPTYTTVASTLEVIKITDGPINTSGPAEDSTNDAEL